MGFVNYDEIKLVRAEPAAEQLHHGLVGGTVDLAGAGPVAQKVHDGHVAQVLAERLRSLLDQAFAVSEEEDVFHPAGLRKLFDQGDCGAGFTGAGRHDQQRPPMPSPESFGDGLQHSDLIGPASYLRVDAHSVEVLPLSPPANHRIQFILRGIPFDCARWIPSTGTNPGEVCGIVQQSDFVPIGIVNDWSQSKLLL